jgi:thiol-disulfide isomerase/thioredoxin
MNGRKFLGLPLWVWFIIIAMIMFNCHLTLSNTKEPFAEDNSKKIKVYNFNTEWCGYSKQFQPEWNKFSEKVAELSYVEAIDVKCDNKDNTKMCKDYKVPGFPTVIAEVNGVKHIYKLERNAAMLLTWVNELNNIKPAPTTPVVSNPDNKIKIYNFNTDWCGFSKRFQPDWDEFTQNTKKKQNLSHVMAIDMKCDNKKNEEFCAKSGVSGFPTVLAEVEGKMVQYNGDRTVASLEAWARKFIL